MIGAGKSSAASPGRLTGRFRPPGDKSLSHRLVLMSLLARGPTRLTGLPDGDDVRSSIRAVETLGLAVHRSGPAVEIHGPLEGTPSGVLLDCGNSASACVC